MRKSIALSCHHPCTYTSVPTDLPWVAIVLILCAPIAISSFLEPKAHGQDPLNIRYAAAIRRDLREVQAPGKIQCEVPFFPAERHVPLGCFVDCEVYMAKLAKSNPEMKSELLNIVIKQTDGSDDFHSVVMVTAPTGEKYARDEYFGVFPLDKTDAKSVAKAVERQSRLKIKNGMKCPSRLYADTKSEKRDAVKAASEMIPGSQIFKIGDQTVLFWRPASGGEAVYSPMFGTASTKEEALTLTVVKEVAQELGLKGQVEAPAAAIAAHVATLSPHSTLVSNH